MKKLVMAALLFICGTAAAFAQHETWFSMGFEFANSFEHYTDNTTYIGSPGFTLNGYRFSDNRDLGMFFHYGILSAVAAAGDTDVQEYGFQMDFMIGPGFQYNFSDALKLQFGVGIDWMPIFAEYTKKDENNIVSDFSKTVHNIGIGLDVGIKYVITDFFVSGGLTLSYMFYNHTSLYSQRADGNELTCRTRYGDGILKGYGMLTVRPYLAIGVRFLREKGVWGREFPGGAQEELDTDMFRR
jgi:hypothetical protein